MHISPRKFSVHIDHTFRRELQAISHEVVVVAPENAPTVASGIAVRSGPYADQEAFPVPFSSSIRRAARASKNFRT